MAYYTGPVTPDWKLFDDESGQLLMVKVKQRGVTPRTGEILHDIDKHTHWEVSKVGGLTAEDLRKRPPVLYYPIYGHGGQLLLAEESGFPDYSSSRVRRRGIRVSTDGQQYCV